MEAVTPIIHARTEELAEHRAGPQPTIRASNNVLSYRARPVAQVCRPRLAKSVSAIPRPGEWQGSPKDTATKRW